MEPVTIKQWQLRSDLPEDPRVITALSQQTEIPDLVVRLLWLRGIQTPEGIQAFLDTKLANLPDPALLPDMEKSCLRLWDALRNHERIAVHGDYDVDGITGCSLLVEVLQALGAEVEYHIPLRLVDGYGLSAEALRLAHQRGCRVVVSVDCGVSAHHEAEIAAELGMDLIITDHHQPPEHLPTCYALINPHLPGHGFPWKDLSGVGVAFFLMLALRRLLREQEFFTSGREPDLRYVLDLVALGTIADIVPLGGVNRIMVKQGLQLLEKSRRPGITALKEVAQVKEVSSGVVGFRLAPRLNAAGRLEDAAMGVDLLLNGDPAGCAELARYLDDCNRQRQLVEQQTLQEAIAMVEQSLAPDRFTIVLAREGWHSGVIGIVASRLVERYHRPVVLIALEDGLGKGSARSIKGFHLYEALCDCRATLDGFGGHAMAAGLSIAADRLQAFIEQFETIAQARLDRSLLQPTLVHDGTIPLGSLSLTLLESLHQLAPHGAGNPQPTFVARDCRLLNCRVVGRSHLKFDVEQEGTQIPAIAFGMAERMPDAGSLMDLAFHPGINEWRGERTVQLQVIDFRETGAEDHDN